VGRRLKFLVANGVWKRSMLEAAFRVRECRDACHERLCDNAIAWRKSVTKAMDKAGLV
jgi:hypothetical protein